MKIPSILIELQQLSFDSFFLSQSSISLELVRNNSNNSHIFIYGFFQNLWYSIRVPPDLHRCPDRCANNTQRTGVGNSKYFRDPFNPRCINERRVALKLKAKIPTKRTHRLIAKCRKIFNEINSRRDERLGCGRKSNADYNTCVVNGIDWQREKKIGFPLML